MTRSFGVSGRIRVLQIFETSFSNTDKRGVVWFVSGGDSDGKLSSLDKACFRLYAMQARHKGRRREQCLGADGIRRRQRYLDHQRCTNRIRAWKNALLQRGDDDNGAIERIAPDAVRYRLRREGRIRLQSDDEPRRDKVPGRSEDHHSATRWAMDPAHDRDSRGAGDGDCGVQDRKARRVTKSARIKRS